MFFWTSHSGSRIVTDCGLFPGRHFSGPSLQNTPSLWHIPKLMNSLWEQQRDRAVTNSTGKQSGHLEGTFHAPLLRLSFARQTRMSYLVNILYRSRKNYLAIMQKIVQKQGEVGNRNIGNLRSFIVLQAKSENTENERSIKGYYISSLPFPVFPLFTVSSFQASCLAFTHSNFPIFFFKLGKSVDASGCLPCSHLNPEASFYLEQKNRFG